MVSYDDFLDGGLLLTRKVMNQYFVVFKWKSLRRHDFINHYGTSESQMNFADACLTNVTTVIRQVPLVEQELFFLPEHTGIPFLWCL